MGAVMPGTSFRSADPRGIDFQKQQTCINVILLVLTRQMLNLVWLIKQLRMIVPQCTDTGELLTNLKTMSGHERYVTCVAIPEDS